MAGEGKTGVFPYTASASPSYEIGKFTGSEETPPMVTTTG